jgi:hypothetical protein
MPAPGVEENGCWAGGGRPSLAVRRRHGRRRRGVLGVQIGEGAERLWRRTSCCRHRGPQIDAHGGALTAALAALAPLGTVLRTFQVTGPRVGAGLGQQHRRAGCRGGSSFSSRAKAWQGAKGPQGTCDGGDASNIFVPHACSRLIQPLQVDQSSSRGALGAALAGSDDPHAYPAAAAGRRRRQLGGCRTKELRHLIIHLHFSSTF